MSQLVLSRDTSIGVLRVERSQSDNVYSSQLPGWRAVHRLQNSTSGSFSALFRQCSSGGKSEGPRLGVGEVVPLFMTFIRFPSLQALSTVLQINADYSGDFDFGYLSAGWFYTKIMSLSSQVLLNHSGDQNGLLGQIHINSL